MSKEEVDGSKLEAIGEEIAAEPNARDSCSWAIKPCNLYKHGLSRRYLNLGDDGRAYRLPRACGRFEIPFEEALNWVAEPLTEMGETLETPYDEEYRARRSAALRAGWHEPRVHLQPGEVATH